MKLRYLLFLLVVVAAVALGVARLLTKMWAAGARMPEKTACEAPVAPVADTLRGELLDEPDAPVPAPQEEEVAPDSVPAPVAAAAPVVEEVALPVDSVFYHKTAWQAAAQRYATARPVRWSDHQVEGVVYRVDVPASHERVVFLTFNAYVNDYPELFETLEQHRVPATLFLSGAWVRRHPGQARRLGALRGLYEIENHGNSNVPLSVNGARAYHRSGTQSLRQALDEVWAGAEAIRQATGQTPRYVRPFMNYTDDVVVRALREVGVKTVGATLFADGGGSYGSTKIKELILAAPHGTVVLISIDARYPNILAGLREALETIAEEKRPIRFEQLARYEAYFETFTR
jgi:peptidoglycan/xylan/chitin deacetylase (PgdA/CDA1 family)